MIYSIQSDNVTFGGLKEIIAKMELLGATDTMLIESMSNSRTRINTVNGNEEPGYIALEIKD